MQTLKPMDPYHNWSYRRRYYNKYCVVNRHRDKELPENTATMLVQMLKALVGRFYQQRTEPTELLCPHLSFSNIVQMVLYTIFMPNNYGRQFLHKSRNPLAHHFAQYISR